MVKHIVCFMLKDKSEENCRQAQEVLLSMRGKIEQIRDLQVGIDFLHSERSCDVILEMTFDSVEVMNEYKDHPYHVNVVQKHMHSVRESSVSADYEF